MRFPKDILIIDFEGRDGDEPVQVGAVLLDKDTLEEKQSFLSYIFADLRGRPLQKSGITQKMINNAPSAAEVGKRLHATFGTNVFLGSWAANLDMKFFNKLLQAAGLSWSQYDYHVIDIWPAAYLSLLQHGYTGGWSSEEMFQAFGAPPRTLHHALEDCRLAAAVLRKIVS